MTKDEIHKILERSISLMHLISIRNLRDSAAKYVDVENQIEDWYATVKRANWSCLEDVRLIYSSA